MNLVPDSCELAGGDANGDGTLDVCELDGFLHRWRVVDQWSGGFIAELDLVNDSGQCLKGWEVLFSPTGFEVTGSWNGRLAPTDPGQVRLVNETWNADFCSGTTLTIGMQCSGSPSTPGLPERLRDVSFALSRRGCQRIARSSGRCRSRSPHRVGAQGHEPGLTAVPRRIPDSPFARTAGCIPGTRRLPTTFSSRSSRAPSPRPPWRSPSHAPRSEHRASLADLARLPRGRDLRHDPRGLTLFPSKRQSEDV